MCQLDFHTQPGGGRATRSLGGGWWGSERAGQRGGWCHKPLSTSVLNVFRVVVFFHILKTMTLRVGC